MEIKKDPPVVNNQTSARKKEERVPPKRNFHELMATRKRRREPEKRRTIFDVASKDKEKSGPPLRKKREDHTPHYGEGIQEGMASLEVGESFSVSSMTKLSPEMAVLVEKMANFILIASQNGVSTTTVMVEMDGSVLDGSQVVIDRYDTAPPSFNLQLSGSPEAADLLSANLASLQDSLQTNPILQNFQVHVLPPVLSEKSDLFSQGRERKRKLGNKDKSSLDEGEKKISF